MADGDYTIRVKRFMSNPLLQRKQFMIEVRHVGKATIPKQELKKKISKLYKVADPNTIILFGFRTQFGGGKSTGFGMIYDNIMALKKFELRYRQVRFSLAEPKAATRRAKKDIKIRQKKVRGKEKVKVATSSGTKKAG